MKSRSSRRSRWILIKRWRQCFNSSKPCQNPETWCCKSLELRDVRDAAQDVARLVEIPEGNEDEPLTLAGRLQKVPESFVRYVPTTTRQYVGHVLGLVRSYWPRTPLDPLGKGAKADCTDEQFNQYQQETSGIADQIVETLNKSGSPWTACENCLPCGPKVHWTNVNICVMSSTFTFLL